MDSFVNDCDAVVISTSVVISTFVVISTSVVFGIGRVEFGVGSRTRASKKIRKQIL